MKKSLLFIPDISGFTKFVQTTEVEHSQHVIAELLEILIDVNGQDLQLAEVEGDALFFYKEEEIPSLDQLLTKVEAMFTAFYSHLKLLKKNRICPCNACATAPNLDLKIIAHSGELQFISIQNNRKPFGAQVIEVHRLMKNSVNSDNYVLFSKELADDLKLAENYPSEIYNFKQGEDKYDGKEISYVYSTINQEQLKLIPFAQTKKIHFDSPPAIFIQKEYPIAAPELFEYISNFIYRQYLIEGDAKFIYNENEVSRIGTKHLCIIDGKDIDFTTVTKEGLPGQLVYGEVTTTPPVVDGVFSFSIVTPLSQDSSKLEIEIYWKTNSSLKRILFNLLAKKTFRKNMLAYADRLSHLVEKKSGKVEA